MTDILTVTLNPALDVAGETGTIRATRKVRTANERYDPGGGGLNVARVVVELGGAAEALFIAGGETGDLLERLVRQHGLKARRIAVDGLTRIGFTIRETSTGLEYRFVPEGQKVPAAAIEACLDAVAGHESRYVVASGSLPAGAPPDILARMARLAAARGARFVLDSSGAGLSETLGQAPVHLVKPSRGELERLVGRPLEIEAAGEAAAAMVSRGEADIVAVTLGADGAILADRDGVEILPAIHVRVRSTVGAGDSFVAAMTLALARGEPPRAAFRLGIAAGAAAAMTPGTELCRAADVARLHASRWR